MKRVFIIALCALNTLIACGLLWYILGSRKVEPVAFPQNSPPKLLEVMDDQKLWETAADTTHPKEAFNLLNRIQDNAFALQQSTSVLMGLTTDQIPEFKNWPFNQAIIRLFGLQCPSPERLVLLSQVAKNTELPLTLRATAFQSFIENSLRFTDVPEIEQESFKLIDYCFSEKNSLLETSLQAENFLRLNGVSSSVEREDFRSRLVETVKSNEKPTQARIIALNILSNKSELKALDTEQIFVSANTDLRTAFLRVFLQSSEEIRLEWLRPLTPSNPEQEQLVQKILQ